MRILQFPQSTQWVPQQSCECSDAAGDVLQVPPQAGFGEPTVPGNLPLIRV